MGAVGGMLLAVQRGQLDLVNLREVVRQTTLVTSMVFMIFIGGAVLTGVPWFRR